MGRGIAATTVSWPSTSSKNKKKKVKKSLYLCGSTFLSGIKQQNNKMVLESTSALNADMPVRMFRLRPRLHLVFSFLKCILFSVENTSLSLRRGKNAIHAQLIRKDQSFRIFLLVPGCLCPSPSGNE